MKDAFVKKADLNVLDKRMQSMKSRDLFLKTSWRILAVGSFWILRLRRLTDQDKFLKSHIVVAVYILISTMRWLHLIYSLLLYSEKCAASFSMSYFMDIANLEFNQIPMHHFCGISVINCAGKCDMDVACLAFNYNRGTRTCRLVNFDLFNQTAWPEFAQNEEWTVYLKLTSHGKILDIRTYNYIFE